MVLYRLLWPASVRRVRTATTESYTDDKNKDCARLTHTVQAVVLLYPCHRTHSPPLANTAPWQECGLWNEIAAEDTLYPTLPTRVMRHPLLPPALAFFTLILPIPGTPTHLVCTLSSSSEYRKSSVLLRNSLTRFSRLSPSPTPLFPLKIFFYAFCLRLRNPHKCISNSSCSPFAPTFSQLEYVVLYIDILVCPPSLSAQPAYTSPPKQPGPDRQQIGALDPSGLQPDKPDELRFVPQDPQTFNPQLLQVNTGAANVTDERLSQIRRTSGIRA
ncbi:hypothetical protein B0H16DRAFT_1719473 [Mycena metata]|uniref:Uncharacterized protein n=1 Tax=Mycena metata TaxID=1033252 RepID=A0AAD7JC90_9AGAR|nr:hypothetical protein B0H16DRAFT_1719473 [Mycena metata]